MGLPPPGGRRTISESYHELDAGKIIQTTAVLHQRIERRFPGSGLAQVCDDLHGVTQRASSRSKEIARPLWKLRLAVIALLAVLTIIVPVLVTLLASKPENGLTIVELIQVAEAGFNDIVLIGAAVFFLWTFETRIRRRRALEAIHELRSIAHIIDMHQLTKDPERLYEQYATEEEPLSLNAADLGRYLDYCSEMLSLVGKVAALYVQRFDDSVALSSANEVETLCTGLTRKIWQKIMIIHQYQGDEDTQQADDLTGGEGTSVPSP